MPSPSVSAWSGFARIVGRENVIAGADCGFAASGVRFNDTHPSVAWLKFAALAEGAPSVVEASRDNRSFSVAWRHGEPETAFQAPGKG